MNRRLFWKIFLPFWVAQALLLGALYLRLHVRLHSERPWWTQPSRQVMPELGHRWRRGAPARSRDRPPWRAHRSTLFFVKTVEGIQGHSGL